MTSIQAQEGLEGPSTEHTSLKDLVKANQGVRWRQGNPILVEAYLDEHPVLQADSDAILELVCNEIELRQEKGDAPKLEEYVRRFSHFEAQLQELFASPRTQMFSITASKLPDLGLSPTAGEDLPVVPGYQVIRELGRGGMGVVYAAIQSSLKRPVALKMLLAGAHANPTTRARLRTEAEAVARLVHPNIVPIFEVGEYEGRSFLCLEYVSGGSLDEKVAGAAQPEREAARLVETLARAVHYTHQRGILHRDLKPSNVLLTGDGTPKITDFGLAKLMDDRASQTQTEALIGTPNYMSPEQAAGNAKKIGVTADVYSLGAILYVMLTGRAPFRGTSVLQVLDQVRHREPVPPRRMRSSSSPDLETICLKCLEKEPGHRYATAEALADDLHNFLEGNPIQARPIPAWQRLWRSARRQPALIARVVGVVALACVLLASLWYFQVSGQLTQHRTEEKYQRFVQRRNDAMLYGLLASDQGTLFLGAEASVNLQAAETAAREALALAGLTPDSAASAIDPALPDYRKAEIAEDCYALLLVLASVKGQAPPSDPTAQEQVQKALRFLDTARQLGFQTRAYHQRRATLLEKAGNLEEARQEKEQAEALPPERALDFFLIGEEQYRRDRCEEAIHSFNRALAKQPTHFWAQFFQSVCHLKMQHFEAAKAGLNACLSQRPDFVWGYLFRSFAHEKLQEFTNAEADIQKALLLNPNVDARYVLFLTRGILHFNQKDLEHAAADFQAALKLKPDQYNAYMNLAAVYLMQGEFGRAAEQFETAMRLHPPVQLILDYHVSRGRQLLRVQKFEEAIQACKTALEFSPLQALPCAVSGHAFLQLGRFDQAEFAFDEYLRRGGESTPEIFWGRGLARMKLGKYVEAAEDYTRVVERAPDAEIYQHRGWAYFFADAWKLALRDFSKAIELSSEAGDGFIGRGLAQVMLGNYRDAVADADAALRRKPKAPEMMLNLACLFAEASVRAEADTTQQDRASLAAVYRSRALQAVQKSLALLRSEERRAFWRDKIFPDPFLKPLHGEPQFRQLQELYNQP